MVARVQAPCLLGLLLQAAPTDRALVRVQQVTPQGVQALALVELPSNLAPVGLVGQVAGRVDGAAQRAPLLERRCKGVLLTVGAGQLAHDQGTPGVPELE